MKGAASGRSWTAAAFAGLVAFCLIAAIEDLVNPRLNPRTHEVSEYVHTSLGWLMIVGFAAWALSLASSAIIASTGGNQKIGFRVVRAAALTLAAIGIAVTTCFATQTSAGRLPAGVRLGLGGQLHDLGSGAATLALVVALLVSVAGGDGTRQYRLIAIALLMTAITSNTVLLCIGPSVGGLRQRAVLACGVAWQFLALRQWAVRRHES